MTTIDNLLIKIVNSSSPKIEESLSLRDCRVLRSLAKSVSSQFFITENQSKLLVKILRENSKKIPNFSEELETELANPTWSNDFRKIEQVKKFYIEKNKEDELVLTIEFSFNSQFRKNLGEISKKCENLVKNSDNKKYHADLTEKNIVVLYEILNKYDFKIDEKIVDHYNIIKSWSEREIRDQFLISNIVYPNFHKHITTDLGVDTPIGQSIINDRSVRYQYFTSEPKNFGETLTENIANRGKSTIWVNSTDHSLSDVVSSLQELRRLPILFVFDQYNGEKIVSQLKNVSTALEDNGITDGVGIYFRLPNDETGKKFNSTIAEKKYNDRLEETTKIVGVQSGKIPKFLITANWRPMSVVVLNNQMGLRHGKTGVYANNCDLVIEYADEPKLLSRFEVVG